MPHLSPMNWPLSILFFLLTLSLLLTNIWWHPQPNFPSTLSHISPPPSSTWTWA